MLIEVNKWIMKLDSTMIDKLAKKASPLAMTPVGKILFKQSGAEKALTNNLDFLLIQLGSYKPQTAYDVENYALTVLLQSIGSELFNEVHETINVIL